MPDKLFPQFAAFFRPTGVGTATRYGVGTIGAVFDAKGRMSGIDTTVVMALTHGEHDRYLREYTRQVREGALEQVDEKAYVAFLERSAPKPPQKDSATKGHK